MQRFKTAVFGTGFVGRVHLEGIRRLGNVDLYAIGEPQIEKANQLAAEFGVPKTEADYRRILEDPAVDAVHICTPNALHFPMAKDALQAGKHVICEKPLATSVDEARQLVKLAARDQAAQCHVPQPALLPDGAADAPHARRRRPRRHPGGAGHLLAGLAALRHRLELAHRFEGERPVALPRRYRLALVRYGRARHRAADHVRSAPTCRRSTRRASGPKGPIETFAGKTLTPEDYIEVPIDTEDFGAVVFRMGDRTRGTFTASQVSAGRKNRLNIEIFGTKAGVAWDQERPDELWIGQRNSNNQIIVKDPSLLKERARSYADLPGGHSEGYDDTFKQVFRRFYASIGDPSAHARVPAVRRRPAPAHDSRSRTEEQRDPQLGRRSRVPGGDRLIRLQGQLASGCPSHAFASRIARLV